ncbi:hypothetical protein AB0945_43335 [Streptomyces sp. NPDC005474]|uniref:hypothetical protein n=1 Tax=Streptomyces sp. NPDC005474 TaxID=3154878 RepID=UPI003453D2D3
MDRPPHPRRPARTWRTLLVLVVSELVTNSLRHDGGHHTLELTADPVFTDGL